MDVEEIVDEMDNQKLIIAVVVGYMLKVLKNCKKITHFKDEFSAIRHGDYITFIDLVGGPLPFMVVYNEGVIKSGKLQPSKDDIDFELLLKSGPSLKIFYYNCLVAYGEIIDKDISDELFENAVLFEIGIRMHANNFTLLNERSTLETVINLLCDHKNIPAIDKDIIHKGRLFLNMIKHNKKHFSSWQEAKAAFNDACHVLSKYRLTVI